MVTCKTYKSEHLISFSVEQPDCAGKHFPFSTIAGAAGVTKPVITSHPDNEAMCDFIN